MAKDLLFEVGVEEIPAGYVPPAIAALGEAVVRGLDDARLSHGDVETFATPRRMCVIVRGVVDAQDDVEREAVGPPVRAAYAEDGTPTKAAVGFARSQGVEVEDLQRMETDKGEYIFVRVTDRGRDAADVLPTVLTNALSSVGFPKTMRWGPEERFARPIRWLVALLGSETIEMSYAGVDAGAETRGHRFWSEGTHRIKDADAYINVLTRQRVIADVGTRRSLIADGATRAAEECGGRVVEDRDLLEELTFLVEYPTVFSGRFDERFLRLPRDVIVAAMKGHQRYFAVEDERGMLLPYFLCVTNTTPEPVAAIREGNERVLVSRLDDAEFYWQEDTRTPLASKVEALRNVVWLEELGSLFEKTERLERLAREVGESLCAADVDTAARAARLAKADLVTEMVKDGKEFTKLQGAMGREYAIQSGEPAAVAEAIYEHYLPRFAGDALPETSAGTVLSIADKIDSIAGCFSVGLVPSGSQDPYALRRQAIGLLRIVIEKELPLSTTRLVASALDGYAMSAERAAEVSPLVIEFLRQRARNVLIDEGAAYDLVDAVLEASFDDLVGASRRLTALARFREADDFTGLVIAARRASNILKGVTSHEPNPAALVEPQSLALEKARSEASESVRDAIERGDFDAAVRSLLHLRRPIDEFFDNVMVMVDDETLKAARLGLLAEVRSLFLTMADFARVVLEGEEPQQ